MTTTDQVRDYWDADAPTYDRAPSHHPRSPAVLAAWRGTLRRLLPPPPAKVLDAGAGTGFVSLLLAELGYQVTAVDVSSVMLEALDRKASERSLAVTTIQGDAAVPPPGPFDAVVERHLIWTLVRPDLALDAWWGVATGGRLVLLETVWGSAADPVEAARALGRSALVQLRRQPPEHHAEYDHELRNRLPLGHGTDPDQLADLVSTSSWSAPRIHRLTDVEWAARRALPLPERLLGVTPRYALVAGR